MTKKQRKNLNPMDKIDTDQEVTEFEYLYAKVDVLEEKIQLIARILAENNLVRTVKEEPGVFYDDDVVDKLEELKEYWSDN